MINNRVRVLIIAVFTFINSAFCQAQQDSTRIRDVFSFTPSKVNRINGLAIGLWNKPQYHKQIINGLNIELIGSGWLAPFIGLDDGDYFEKAIDKQTINGFSFGLTLLNGNINGISFASLVNITNNINGIKFGLINYNANVSNGIELGLINMTYKSVGTQIGIVNLGRINKGASIGLYNCSFSEVRGLQIGLINRTQKLRGIQIGLININKSRTTILFNWQSKGD